MAHRFSDGAYGGNKSSRVLQERQGGTVTENKQKLIALVSALEEENIIDYCYTFIGLKVYGQARLPEGITAELRQMWEKL